MPDLDDTRSPPRSSPLLSEGLLLVLLISSAYALTSTYHIAYYTAFGIRGLTPHIGIDELAGTLPLVLLDFFMPLGLLVAICTLFSRGGRSSTIAIVICAIAAVYSLLTADLARTLILVFAMFMTLLFTFVFMMDLEFTRLKRQVEHGTEAQQAEAIADVRSSSPPRTWMRLMNMLSSRGAVYGTAPGVSRHRWMADFGDLIPPRTIGMLFLVIQSATLAMGGVATKAAADASTKQQFLQTELQPGELALVISGTSSDLLVGRYDASEHRFTGEYQFLPAAGRSLQRVDFDTPPRRPKTKD